MRQAKKAEMSSTGRETAADATSYSIVGSPVGDLMLAADATALTGVYFAGRDHIPTASRKWASRPDHPILQQAAAEIGEYFEGERKNFSIPLRPAGTEFQRKVWQQIAVIPFGETITYSTLAKRSGAPAAIRAAGTITGRNPISIIVPCHRVVGKNGSMCGFAGGLDRKEYLLRHESGGQLELRSS